MKCSFGISDFLEEIPSLSYCVVFPLFLCIDRWRRLSYLFLLFFGTLHSGVYIFPFLLCFSLPFFSQLVVRPSQTAILLFCISFSWGWSWFLSPVQCHEPLSIIHQALCLSDLVLRGYSFRRGLEKYIRQNEYQNFFSRSNMLQFSAELKISHSYNINYIPCDSSVRKNHIQEFQQNTHTLY